MLALFAALATTVALAQESVDPTEPYESPVNNFYMNAIEYWGTCEYHQGRGVSFGFRTNEIQSNQDCARQAFDVLKAALDANPPVLSELAEVGGPQSLYLIMSDCTQPGAAARSGSIWHYNGAPNGTDGMIKFHAATNAVTSETGEVSVTCSVPTAEQLYEFARRTRDRIIASRRPTE